MRKYKHLKTGVVYELITVYLFKIEYLNYEFSLFCNAKLERTYNEYVLVYMKNDAFYIKEDTLSNLVLYRSTSTGVYWLRDKNEFFDGRFEEIETDKTSNLANNIQVGGDHYKIKTIQPWDFISANNMGFFEGTILKYIARWKNKNGIEDLKKARHYLDKLIEIEECKNEI